MEKMIYSRRCDNCMYAVPLMLLHPALDGEEPTYCCTIDAIAEYGDGVAVEVLPYDVCDRHTTIDDMLSALGVHE